MNVVLKRTIAPIAVTLAMIVAPYAPAHARAVATLDFANGNVSIGSIAIVPPQAEMTTRKVGADDSMIEESRLLEQYGLDNTVRLLEEKGYDITTISPDDLAQDSELQDLVRRANDRFDEEYAKLARKPGLLKKGRYTIGEEAQQLADYLDVDAVVFERIYMEAAAGGQMAMAFIMGRSAGGASFSVTLANGSDGSVFGYYNWALGAIGKNSATTKSEEMVTQMATKALKKFPVRSAAVAVSGQDGDDTDLAELEALLGEDSDRTDLDESVDAELEELEELEEQLETESDEGSL